METVYSIPFYLLEVPNLKIKRPSWFHQPSAMVMFAVVLVSYFLVTGGIFNRSFTISINSTDPTNKFTKFIYSERFRKRKPNLHDTNKVFVLGMAYCQILRPENCYFLIV